MMNISFRGWCERDSEWRYGFYVTDGVHHEILTLMDSGEFYASQVDADTVGLCTTCKDKSGKLIYQGDIVKHSNGRVSEVVWDEFGFEFGSSAYVSDREDGFDPESCEVVGDIFLNGELLPYS